MLQQIMTTLKQPYAQEPYNKRKNDDIEWCKKIKSDDNEQCNKTRVTTTSDTMWYNQRIQCNDNEHYNSIIEHHDDEHYNNNTMMTNDATKLNMINNMNSSTNNIVNNSNEKQCEQHE
jgi:hypothetical protein